MYVTVPNSSSSSSSSLVLSKEMLSYFYTNSVTSFLLFVYTIVYLKRGSRGGKGKCREGGRQRGREGGRVGGREFKITE